MERTPATFPLTTATPALTGLTPSPLPSSASTSRWLLWLSLIRGSTGLLRNKLGEYLLWSEQQRVPNTVTAAWETVRWRTKALSKCHLNEKPKCWRLSPSSWEYLFAAGCPFSSLTAWFLSVNWTCQMVRRTFPASVPPPSMYLCGLAGPTPPSTPSFMPSTPTFAKPSPSSWVAIGSAQGATP